MILIKNVEVYSPASLGKKDVLVCGGKVEWIANSIEFAEEAYCTAIDGTGKLLVPGLIDRHIHITGGGGEGGLHTRAPEVNLSALIQGGITTVLGLLGTDGITRSIENLLSKAKALYEEGITAFICTGSYGYPSITLTDDVKKDIVFIPEILGLKLALSDHRAPNITTEQLIRLASDTRVAGMVGKKPGFLVLHMGNDKLGLTPVFDALSSTSIPIKIFQPTHCNRNPDLLKESFRFLEMGGYIDFTCDMEGEPTPAECIIAAKEKGIPTVGITCTSDGQGSWSKYDEFGNLVKMGVSSVSSIFRQFQSMVRDYGFSIAEAITYVSTNPAKALEIYPQKGCIAQGCDADLLLLDENLELNTVIARGNILMKEYTLLKRGTYED